MSAQTKLPRLTRFVNFFTKKPYNYVKRKAETPKTSLAQLALASWIGYKVGPWIYHHTVSDAIAFEKVRAHVLEQAKKHNQIEMENTNHEYHTAPLKHILVILNPASSHGDSGKHFENMIQPLLDVSGFDVHVHKTKSVLDARDVSETLIPDKFSALIIVGGDGTISEVMTGLLRRPDHQELLNSMPIGIIPTGQKNNTYKNLVKNQTLMAGFNDLEIHEKADFIINETERILSNLNSSTSIATKHNAPENFTAEPIMEIKMKRKSESEEEFLKRPPTYALSSLEWGINREAVAKKENYWFIVPFKMFWSRFSLANHYQDEDNKQKIQCELQYEKVTEDKKLTGSASRFSKNQVEQVEIDVIDEFKEIVADNFVCQIRDWDRKYLELEPTKNLGTAFDFGMTDQFLTIFSGNKPNVHRIKMSNFVNAKNIYIDGNDYEMDDVEFIEVRYKNSCFNMIQ